MKETTDRGGESGWGGGTRRTRVTLRLPGAVALQAQRKPSCHPQSSLCPLALQANRALAMNRLPGCGQARLRLRCSWLRPARDSSWSSSFQARLETCTTTHPDHRCWPCSVLSAAPRFPNPLFWLADALHPTDTCLKRYTNTGLLTLYDLRTAVHTCEPCRFWRLPTCGPAFSPWPFLQSVPLG